MAKLKYYSQTKSKQHKQSDGALYDLADKDPHRTLYLSVIVQALLDLTKTKKKNEASDITLQRDQAHAWFFTSTKDFETICHYAGVEPKKVRTFAYEVIQSGDTENVRRRFSSLIY